MLSCTDLVGRCLGCCQKAHDFTQDMCDAQVVPYAFHVVLFTGQQPTVLLAALDVFELVSAQCQVVGHQCHMAEQKSC